MTSKDRVKLNVYKSLLEEEKKKNRKLVVMGASLFVMGIFTDTVYQSAVNKVNGNDILKNSVALEQHFDFNKSNQTEVLAWENFYENNIFKEREIEMNPEELFVSDLGI
ncbi:hypothetical protein [uncultured Ilyobacter sp.]|uniref:hypothetical protein n=1 Tax=uncultured Ilyobacter sp. TaxID=544433 RepID=UPI0029C61239|nr:hypothetical protein [uncultured Ilyobacter sp.]